VILGLLCPFYITKLEFKFKEELQLVPHSEEGHMFHLEEEDKSTEGQPEDINHNMDAYVEVGLQSECIENKNCCQHQTLS
jgi:transient receptor potential cation channel subfamily M protein 3